MLSEGFARVFGDGDDQVLAVLDVDEEDAPEIRVYAKPPGLGLCNVGLKYKSDKAAEKAFCEMTEENVRAVAKQLFEAGALLTEK